MGGAPRRDGERGEERGEGGARSVLWSTRREEGGLSPFFCSRSKKGRAVVTLLSLRLEAHSRAIAGTLDRGVKVASTGVFIE